MKNKFKVEGLIIMTQKMVVNDNVKQISELQFKSKFLKRKMVQIKNERKVANGNVQILNDKKKKAELNNYRSQSSSSDYSSENNDRVNELFNLAKNEGQSLESRKDREFKLNFQDKKLHFEYEQSMNTIDNINENSNNSFKDLIKPEG